MSNAKSFLKWVGGKRQLLKTINNYYPKELGTKINKYCEPMVGGGAVLFDVLEQFEFKEVMINDLNKELINVYIVIKENVNELIKLLTLFESEHLKRNNAERKKYYYRQRNLYNTVGLTPDSKILKAALFIYLNKTCFNGLYRVNKQGKYNVPVGKYKNPKICDKENLKLASKLLQKVKITSGDYKLIEDFVDENTFVYFDPPYRPLSKSAGFTSYTQTSFDDNCQIELAKFIKDLSDKGAKVLVSNSDPKNTNPNDNFFDDLYKSMNINRVKARRSVNSNGQERGTINELLICNF